MRTMIVIFNEDKLDLSTLFYSYLRLIHLNSRWDN